MKKPRAAAIYARISSDPDGTALGVERQVEDCRALAEREGWTVAETYIDNDVSAFSGKHRREYERMMADLADGLRDGVVVYHMDRLTRRPIELEQFVATVERAGVHHVRFVAGADVDLANGDGLMVARLMAAVAANESTTKSRRAKRKYDQLAAAGLPGGGPRPYGYDADRMTIRPEEAEIVRAVAARYLAGESPHSIAQWLQDGGHVTTWGTPWNTTNVRYTLKNPRYAGLREHRGQIAGPAAWPAIITEDEHGRIVALMAERKTTRKRTPRKYLLTGLARCGKCGGKLYSAHRENRTRRYVCLSGTDHGGCGGIQITAEPLERLVVDAVLYRLDTPELADALTGAAANDAHALAIAQAVQADQAQLIELADLYASKAISSTEWVRARDGIEQRKRDNERRLTRLTRNDALTGLPGTGDQLRDTWADLPLSRQVAIVSALLSHVTIHPYSASARRVFDPSRAELVWRA